jgi:O-acetyl-ADP-ribose deacetylase (regulator of RNase III)
MVLSEMTIELTANNDIFACTNAKAWVNTVNCKGFMGKGLALAFRKRFPGNFEAYSSACDKGEVVIGKILVFDLSSPGGELFDPAPQWILNFPTKKHWRSGSRIEWIEAGLVDLVKVVQGLSIPSIAIPALGCGLGGLNWDQVRPLIERAFMPISDVHVYLCGP